MNKELNISQLASAYNGVLLHSMSGRQDDGMLFYACYTGQVIRQ